MTKPLLSNVHVHLTDTLEKCWTCAEVASKIKGFEAVCYVGGQTFTLKDQDIGIIACPRCAKEKII